MQLPQFHIPSVNQNIFRSISSGCWRPQFRIGKSWQLPRLEANILTHTKYNNKPIDEMVGNLRIKKFNFKKSIEYAKKGSYTR